MDDFNTATLTESRNEYCAMLISRLTPQVIQGIYSIFNEAVQLCQENDEDEKYLMTFQNFLGRVPKWNQDIVEKEQDRIVSSTNCAYLEDLLTCVHITQLKLLTNVRAGNKQRKIDINIPSLTSFIHKVYIEVSRKIYKNVFLFEQNILPLQKQKNMRECETIVKECILSVIRESMPLETILKSYLDESTEENVEEMREEIREEVEEIPESEVQATTQTATTDETDNVISNTEVVPKIAHPTLETPSTIETSTVEPSTIESMQSETNEVKKIGFNNTDSVVSYNKFEEPGLIGNTHIETIQAPKNVERLEQISTQRWEERQMDDYDSDDSDESYDSTNEKLTIMNDNNVNVETLGIQSLDTPVKLEPENLLGDVIVMN